MSKPLTIQEINNRRIHNSRLTAIMFGEHRFAKSGKRITIVLCKCICGVIKEIEAKAIMSSVYSCGCYHKELARQLYKKLKPAKYKRKLRQCYYGMMERCYSLRSKAYKHYGGRGVLVCDEWKNNIESFCEWALNNGWKEGLNIDKDIIPAKLGIPAILYSPEMCRFVTPLENQNNRSNIKKYNYNGQFISLPEIARLEKINHQLLRQRINRDGYSLINAINLKR